MNYSNWYAYHTICEAVRNYDTWPSANKNAAWYFDTNYTAANNYMGRAGLINSGGASGENDVAEAVRTAVINKRAGGTGLISGRKAFQRPMAEGVKILNAIQDVYLSKDVTLA